MNQIAVKKAVSAQYPVGGGGAPVMVLGGGGGRGGDDIKGRTWRESIGRGLGGAVGALGALTGRHRSLGSLVQGAISGGAQGVQLGGAAGRGLVGREGQARADLREQSRLTDAKESARLAESSRSRGEGPWTALNPVAEARRRNTAVRDRNQNELERVNRVNRASDAAKEPLQRAHAEVNRLEREEDETSSQSAAERTLDTLRERTGATNIGNSALVAGAAAASPVRVQPARPSSQHDPSDIISPEQIAAMTDDVGAVDAAGNPVQTLSPANQVPIVPPPGSVASGQSSADSLGSSVIAATGLDDIDEGLTVQPSLPQAQATMDQQPPRRREELPDLSDIGARWGLQGHEEALGDPWSGTQQGSVVNDSPWLNTKWPKKMLKMIGVLYPKRGEVLKMIGVLYPKRWVRVE
jgi:hypothetical protein